MPRSFADTDSAVASLIQELGESRGRALTLEERVLVRTAYVLIKDIDER